MLNAPDTATEFSVILPPETVLSCQSVHWNAAMGSPEDVAASSTPEACGSVYRSEIDGWAVISPENPPFVISCEPPRSRMRIGYG